MGISFERGKIALSFIFQKAGLVKLAVLVWFANNIESYIHISKFYLGKYLHNVY